MSAADLNLRKDLATEPHQKQRIVEIFVRSCEGVAIDAGGDGHSLGWHLTNKPQNLGRSGVVYAAGAGRLGAVCAWMVEARASSKTGKYRMEVLQFSHELVGGLGG